MKKLAEAGVRAGVVNHVRDLQSDPEYQHRGVWQALEHPEIGAFRYQVPPFALSESPACLNRPSPVWASTTSSSLLRPLASPRKTTSPSCARASVDRRAGRVYTW